MDVVKLIELLRERAMVGRMEVRDKQLMIMAADALEGVIVPPCKVGDTVYLLDDIVWAYECKGCPYFEEGWYDDPHECRKTKDGRKHHACIELNEHIVTQDDIYSYLHHSLFGKTVFLTKEEAEKALAERKGR